MDGKCISCSGVGGRTTCISPGFALRDYRSHSQVNFASVKCPPKRASLRCTATYNGSRRNQDSPRHNNRNSFSRGRNRPTEDRDGLENLDESDMFNLRNGSPKSHASTVPGQREQEIVELFRKVQVKLRERAARKEEKAESGGGKGNESETVDSLLKLLRKHSVEQTKRTPNGSNKNQQPSGQQVSSFESIRQEDEEEVQVPRNRPPSFFRRKSPVPRVKYEPVYQREVEPVAAELEVESEPELEEFESEPEKVIIPVGEIYSEKFESMDSDEEEDVNEEMGVEEEEYEGEDLSAMKVADLRALAKSRGLKGYSKMKKSDLLELLGGSSI